MADKDEKKGNIPAKDKTLLSNLTALVSRLSLGVYGTPMDEDEIDASNARFHELLKNNEDSINGKGENTTTSFISKLYKTDYRNDMINRAKESSSMTNLFAQDGMFGNNFYQLDKLVDTDIKNKFVKNQCIHDIASMLVELNEAILATRDAIIGSDIQTGYVNRVLNLTNVDTDRANDIRAIIENVERKYELQQKTKEFIIPKGLEYGTYYAYLIPYDKIFNDFIKAKNSTELGSQFNSSPYTESTVYDYYNKTDKRKNEYFNVVKESAESVMEEIDGDDSKSAKSILNEYKENVDELLKRVTICTESVPIPLLDEGNGSLSYYKDKFYTEKTSNKDDSNLFQKIHGKPKEDSSEGLLGDDVPKKDLITDIKDVYIKMIEPMRMIPIKILDEKIGYLYIIDKKVDILDGVVSDAFSDPYGDSSSKKATMIDFIAQQIVGAFDKKWLNDNVKFKHLIVDAIQYYNINERNVRFQFIPVEYVYEFPVNKDENGEGRSMLDQSLFYANLYMLMLMFYIMSTVQYSNDTKVNYIKNSAIDKDVTSKIQEIVRKKQSRNLNLADLFQYTTALNKVSNGNELYYPTGRSGERAIETEIVSGQDIKINNEFLEWLRSAYILATGVPSAIINYLNEADFSRQVQLANTKFEGRVISYQLDFNPSITKFYKGVLKLCTNLDENEIDKFTYELPATKMSNDQITNDTIQIFQTRFNAVKEMLVNEDTPKEIVNNFTILYAKKYAPALEIDEAIKLLDQAKILAAGDKLKPDPANDDEDIDLSDEDLGI